MFHLSWDEAKRKRTIALRGLDFARTQEVFRGVTLEVEDTRREYGETRMLCVGFLDNRMVMVGYVPQGATRRIFSMRKCNAREIRRYSPYFQQA